MDARRWAQVVAAFEELVELEPGAREQRLAAIDDPELRHGVEQLLAADACVEHRLARIDHALSPPRASTGELQRDADPLHLIGRTVSHFRIIEPLARGGMGAVYRAEDTRLRRTIALKFPLPAHQFDRCGQERFLREARVAGALDHPNLCPIYEAGATDDGQLFYAMPLYEGESLRERIAREGALPVADALEVARQIATGLSAAHRAGIVHRDLKPANVMLLRDGTVRILDFGLAKGSDLGLTDSWTTLGTISYMAPEQVQGHEVDGRADLWALGVLLYEMLTGRRPFRGDHAIAVAHAIVHVEPDRPSSLRGEITQGVEAIVETLLRKDPARRHASAGDVAAALVTPVDRRGHRALMPDGGGAPRAWLVAAFTLLVVGFVTARALGIGSATRIGAVGALDGSSALLVAEFDIRGGLDSSLGSALAEGVRADLRQSKVVTIVPDSTIRGALQRMQRPVSAPLVPEVAREVAEREGIEAVVEGELTPLRRHLVVTIRLVSAQGDELLSFHETTDEPGLISTLGRLTVRLRRRMGESLESVRATLPLDRVTTPSFAALIKYSEARTANSETDFVRAVARLREALALDSSFAMAWVALASVYQNAAYPKELADEAAERAYRHRDRLPDRERYHVEGQYFRTGPGRDRMRAAEAYEAGLRVDSGAFANNLALLYMSRREYARAESLFRWYVRRGSPFLLAYYNLVGALSFQGKRAEAESVEVEIARRFPDTYDPARAALFLYDRGELDSAQHVLERHIGQANAMRRMVASSVLSDLHRLRGRLSDAERVRDGTTEADAARGVSPGPLADELRAAFVDIWYRDRPEQGLHRVEVALARTPLASLPVLSPSYEHYYLFGWTYYLWVARTYAQAGRPGQARAVLAQFEADRRDTSLWRASEPAIRSVRGEIALAEGKPLVALEEFRGADRLPDGPVHRCAICRDAAIGRAFDEAGMTDSAIATFERYLETPQGDRLPTDARYAPRILRRLGELHEAKGNPTRALEYYGRFVELWRNADPELKPAVDEVRRRVEALYARTRD